MLTSVGADIGVLSLASIQLWFEVEFSELIILIMKSLYRAVVS